MKPFQLHEPFQMFLFSFSLFIIIPLGPATAQLLINCSYSDNYTANSKFKHNLKLLLSSLSSNAPLTGFYNTSVGNDLDTVYGLSLCRGDVTPDVCRNCLESIHGSILRLCPNKKGAMIRSELCYVRYSNQRFFSVLEDSWTVREQTTSNVSSPNLFFPIMREMMVNLSIQAAFHSANKMFATADKSFPDNCTWYVLMQCTRDLSGNDCNICLHAAIEYFEECCYFSQGATIQTASCDLRYGFLPFYQASDATPSPPPPPPSTNITVDAGGKKARVVILASVAAFVVLALLCFSVYYMWGWKGSQRDKKVKCQEVHDLGAGTNIGFSHGNKVKTQELPLMDLSIVKAATNNFSSENKLGEGGFGLVYKGLLLNGQEIAVKRLSRNSLQGLQEFKNEVILIEKLQHKNLVRLLGCCIDGEEKLLIYEFVPNTSLDVFLFDPTRRAHLDWKTRLHIITGIVRGLLYLHEDSRLKIIHRDLKASNILLDHQMNPKIADFGMARIFGGNQSIANTNRVVGTYGYMAPEYAMAGLFSVKSDVFSFGVLLLEIISGKRNNGFHLLEHSQSLLKQAWQLWCDGKGLELLDPLIVESCPTSEALRSIHIGLLCVQEDAADRPTMSSVVLMLGSQSIALPEPTQPAFSVGRAIVESDQSSSSDKLCSINDLTISNIIAR